RSPRVPVAAPAAPTCRCHGPARSPGLARQAGARCDSRACQRSRFPAAAAERAAPPERVTPPRRWAIGRCCPCRQTIRAWADRAAALGLRSRGRGLLQRLEARALDATDVHG